MYSRAKPLLPIFLVALAGCATGAAAPNRGPGEPGDEKAAARTARDLVKEIYASLRRGDVPGLQSIVAPEVFVVGPRAADVYVTRSDAIVALTGALRSGDRHKLSSRGLKAVSSASGRS